MRNSARAVIFNDNKVLLMFRKVKREDGSFKIYYVLPGGGIEENETMEQTVVRELKEEMNLDIQVIEYIGQEVLEGKGINNFFFCKTIGNTVPVLSGEELDRISPDNYYEPMYVDIKDVEKLNIFAKEFIYKALEIK